MDYCDNLADIVASGILVSYWRRPNSHCFGDRRDCGRNQARHRSWSVGVEPICQLSRKKFRPNNSQSDRQHPAERFLVDFKTSSGTFRNVNAAEMGEGRDFAPVSVLVKRWNAKRLKERLVITAHRQKERKSIDRALLKLS